MKYKYKSKTYKTIITLIQMSTLMLFRFGVDFQKMRGSSQKRRRPSSCKMRNVERVETKRRRKETKVKEREKERKTGVSAAREEKQARNKSKESGLLA